MAPEKLRAYVDGSLPYEEFPEFMRAVTDCPECARKMGQMMAERIGATTP